MLGTPLDQISSLIDPGACRLVKLPDRIWVFGGAFDPKGGTSRSLRESFWKQTLSIVPSADTAWTRGLDRPENHDAWWAFSGYDDLLEFERDACNLARATILFAESPGSLVELGALAIDDHLAGRLFVIVQTSHLQEETKRSFISLGPLKRLSPLGGKCVIGTESKTILPEDDFQLVLEYLSPKLRESHKTEAFHRRNPTHILLLLADLIDLLLVVKVSELTSTVKHFGVELSQEATVRLTKLLQFFTLINIEERGTEIFCVRRRDSEAPWVDYTAKQVNGTERFHRTRFKVDCESWIRAHDRRKMLILERGE